MIHLTYNLSLNTLDIAFPYDTRIVLIVKNIFKEREFKRDETPKVWRVPVKPGMKKLIEQFEKTALNTYGILAQDIKIDAAVYTAIEVMENYPRKNFELSDSIDYHDDAVDHTLGGKLTAPQRVAAAYLARNGAGVILNTAQDDKDAWGSVIGFADITGETPVLVICMNRDIWAWGMAIKHLSDKSVWIISNEGNFTQERNTYATIKGEKKEICVIDYASLPKYKDWLGSINWKFVVVDQVQALVGSMQSISYKIVYDLLAEIGRRVLISRMDLARAPWLVYKMLLLARRTADFGMGEWEFQKRYCGAWEERDKKSLGEPQNIDELRRRLKELCWIDFQENPFATGEEVESV